MTVFATSAHARPTSGTVSHLLRRTVAWLAACRETARQRHALELLNDDRLRDIGLTRADVTRETGRKPWDL